MKLTVSWPRHDHFLVRKTEVTVAVAGGAATPVPVAGGRATFTPTAVPPFTLRLQIAVRADHPGLGLTLLVDQEFEVTATAANPLRWFVEDLDTAAPHPLRDITGLHPLLTSVVAKGSWRVTLDNRTVDVTAAVPAVVPLAGMTADMVDAPSGSSIRTLARTDGVDPQLWTVGTPKACRQAPVSDVLAFLTPQQSSVPTDLPAAVTPGSPANGALSIRRALFMAAGLDVLAPPPTAGDVRSRFLDHFTPNGVDMPNFIVTRGWEPALVASGRHVALATPVPAGGSHNRAATGDLPGFLGDIHRTLRALGDITPPAGGTLGKPRFGLGAHSFGAEAAFAALAAAPAAYSDVILMDPMGIGRNLGLLARVPAKVCLVGYSGSMVGVPFRALRATPGVGARVRLLPKGYPGDAPERAAMATIVGRSANTAPLRNPRSLGHALSPISTPPAAWVPRTITLPSGKQVTERFAMLHQYCAWGADDEGAGGAERHFLTQALLGSDLR